MISDRFGLLLLAALGLLSVALDGCAATSSTGGPEREYDAEDSDAIIGGKPADAYPEAVLVNMMKGGQMAAACSGSLIAPNVVLTAGHCVYGFDGWQIIAPFAGGQEANSSQGLTYDWKNDGEYVDPNQHDVGLIVLDSKIDLAEYPSVADKPVAFGSNVVNIGRIQDGNFSDSELYVSDPHPVTDGNDQGFPYDYAADEIIQSGDSGGPVEIPGASPHVIVAVNSGAGSGSEVLARVDLVFDWIQETVANGGGGVNGGDPNDPGADPNDPGADPNDPNADPNDPGNWDDPGADPNDPGAGQDGCNGLGYEGQCEQDGSVVWCEDGQVQSIPCADYGAWCVTEPWSGWSDCMEF